MAKRGVVGTEILVFDLDGGVVNIELVSRYRDQLLQNTAVVPLFVHHRVAGHGMDAGGEGPDMKVVH